ncbi:MAG: helix-turn-helix domain-containing protein [Bacteroidota bacterium]
MYLDNKVAPNSPNDTLTATLEQLRTDKPEIEIEETEEKIRIPISALRFLADILKQFSKENPISIVPIATEMKTQAVAEFLGCSRPHIVKLVENGEMPFTKVGKHRRILYEDLVKYRNEMKSKQREAIGKLMELDEKSGLYDS